MILVGNTILQGPEGAAVHQVVADMSHKLKSSKKIEKGWKVLNVLHRVCKNPRIMPHTTSDALDFANLVPRISTFSALSLSFCRRDFTSVAYLSIPD